jgi:hypothetical protein
VQGAAKQKPKKSNVRTYFIWPGIVLDGRFHDFFIEKRPKTHVLSRF